MDGVVQGASSDTAGLPSVFGTVLPSHIFFIIAGPLPVIMTHHPRLRFVALAIYSGRLPARSDRGYRTANRRRFLRT